MKCVNNFVWITSLHFSLRIYPQGRAMVETQTLDCIACFDWQRNWNYSSTNMEMLFQGN